MARFVKVTNLGGGVAYINPEHVVLLGPHVENGKQIIGVCTLVMNSPTVIPQVIRGGVEEIAELLRDKPSLIGG